MIIESIVNQVLDGDHERRAPANIEGIMIHRVGIDHQTGVVLGHDARSICDAFLGRVPQWAEVARATGGELAYTLLIGGGAGPDEYDGKIWQALPLSEKGQHARRFSAPYLGIGCIGDFRAPYRCPPSTAQWASLVQVTADLCLSLGLESGQVVGHGEVRGAHGGSKAPGRPAACPGDLLDMGGLRSVVHQEMRLTSALGARRRLDSAGLVD
jgi:hypothetical protein